MQKHDKATAGGSVAANDKASGISAALCYLTVEAERLGLQELAGLIRRAADRALVEARRTG